MKSHFFYPTASGSLGEARRLGLEEPIVKRESEDPPYSNGQPFDDSVRSKLTFSAEDNDGGPLSDSSEVATPKQ